jgi:hypothetical protein
MALCRPRASHRARAERAGANDLHVIRGAGREPTRLRHTKYFEFFSLLITNSIGRTCTSSQRERFYNEQSDAEESNAGKGMVDLEKPAHRFCL